MVAFLPLAIQADVAIKSMDGNTLLDSWGVAELVSWVIKGDGSFSLIMSG